MTEKMRFKGKCAVITGAGDGIGLAYARALAAEGASIVIADVNATSGAKAASEINASGSKAIATTTDVSNDEQVYEMAAAACAAFGGIDILINNAGKHLRTYGVPPTKIDMKLWREAFDVNVTGALVCVRACLPSMRERGGGIIVNQSSNGAFVGRSTYHITKLAMITLTTALAAELAVDNIRVNAIAPGMVDSPAQMATNTPEFQQTIINQQCIKRLGRVDELLGALLYLCSDDSSFMTGQTLIVDGGRILRT